MYVQEVIRVKNLPIGRDNFKDLKQDNYEIMYNSYKEMIRNLYSKKSI